MTRANASLTMAILAAPSVSRSLKSRPATSADTHRLKIARTHAVEEAIHMFAVRAVGPGVLIPSAPAHRSEIHLRGGDHPGGGAQAVQQFAVDQRQAVLGVVRGAKVQVHYGDALGAEAGIHGQQLLQAPHEQQRAHQQHQGERNLRHHQQPAQAEPLAPRRESAAARAHGRGGRDARRPQRRQQAEQQTGTHRHRGGEYQHPQVQPQAHEDRSFGLLRKATSPRLNACASSAPSSRSRRPTAAWLSASNCATSRPRDAPMAWRMAISRSRTLARASSRFARLAQAINSTSPVVASSSQSGDSYSRRRPDTPVAPACHVQFVRQVSLGIVGPVCGRKRGLHEARRKGLEVSAGALHRPSRFQAAHGGEPPGRLSGNPALALAAESNSGSAHTGTATS